MTDQPEQTAPPPEHDAEAAPLAQPERPSSAPPELYDPSLAELLGHLLRAPRRTLERVRAVLYELPEDRLASVDRAHSAAISAERPEDNAVRSSCFEALFTPTLPITRAQAFLAGGLALLTVLAFIGSADLQSVEARRSLDLPFGGALLLIVMVMAAVLAAVNNLGLPLQRLAPLQLPATPSPAVAYQTPMDRFLAAHGLRLVLAFIGILSSLGAWFFNANNRFTALGAAAWLLSIAAWIGVFLPRTQDERWIERIQAWRAGLSSAFRLRWSWTFALLAAILLLGAWLRLSDLSLYLPDMTSDHVEKALDAQKVLDGDRSIFFPNNGGREAFQMYFIALLHQVTGIPISFELIKLASGLEGLLTILIAYWLGRAMYGDESRQLGNLVGLLMAAFVAVSYWHIMLSRLGLRVVLTPLLVMLLLIFLARAVRHNRRGDWILSGVLLGAGLYFYQAVRIVPLLVIFAFLLAIALRARNGRALRAYVLNFTALVVVAFAVFVPLARYLYDYPEFFLERTTGRIFGEDIIEIRNSKGEVIGKRAALVEDRIAALQRNLTVLGETLRRSLLMFNHRGDTAWITGDPDGSPQLDPYTGAFFVLGLGMIFGRMLQRRDPAEWLLPFGILILILPSALAIAFIIEVPSATRASGALAVVYLIAAFGMAATVIGVAQGMPRLWLRRAVYAIAALVVLISAAINYERYFVDAMRDYRNSTFPYRQAGAIMRGFAESTGAYGNVFMVAFPYWWDHRALAIEAGVPKWNNGVLREDVVERILNALRSNIGTPFEMRPDRQMLFFFNPQDEKLVEELSPVFPNGVVIRVAAYKRERDFNLYVVPPLGCAWMQKSLGRIGNYCADGLE
jgi:4-amino-4-deoxy-L-arabinose transferase-like glycosyltransferase